MREFLFIYEGNHMSWGQLHEDGRFLVLKRTEDGDSEFIEEVDPIFDENCNEVGESIVSFYNYIQDDTICIILEENKDKSFTTIKHYMNDDDIYWNPETKKYMNDNDLYYLDEPMSCFVDLASDNECEKRPHLRIVK
jgi:hypothetical protein